MTARDAILQQAMSLTPEDRAYVADALEQSLTNGGFATPEVAADWATEIDRRLAAYARGEEAADDSDTVLQRLRRRLADDRAAR